MRRILENIGVACWFFMDLSWMKGHFTAASLFMCIAMALLIMPPKNIINEHITSWFTTACWFMMNSIWMLREIHNLGEDYVIFKEIYVIWLQDIFMWGGIISICYILFFNSRRVLRVRKFK